jgi:ABC-2 type transport system permease protein
MGALLRSEFVKQIRRLRTYIAWAITLFIPVLMTIAVKANPRDRPGGETGGLFYYASKSGFVMPATALRFTSGFLLVVIVALFAGESIAGEATWGNLRYVLMRPVTRGRLVAAKLAVSVTLAWVSVFIIAVAGLVAGGIAFGYHDVNVFAGLTTIHQSAGDMLGHLGVASVYIAWSLTTVATFAFMLSTMTDSPAGAVVAGVGFYIFSQILDSIEPLGVIRYGLPTHYFDSWVDVFLHDGPSDDMLRGALLQIGYILVFVGVAAWWFRRKDITS